MPLPSHSPVPSDCMLMLIVFMKLPCYLPVIWPMSLFSIFTPLELMSLMLKLSVLPRSSAITSPLVCCLDCILTRPKALRSHYMNGSLHSQEGDTSPTLVHNLEPQTNHH